MLFLNFVYFEAVDDESKNFHSTSLFVTCSPG